MLRRNKPEYLLHVDQIHTVHFEECTLVVDYSGVDKTVPRQIKLANHFADPEALDQVSQCAHHKCM